MLVILEMLLVLLGLFLFLFCGYLCLLALLSIRRPNEAPPSSRARFDVIVPAHDEAEGIGATVDDLRRLDYPKERRRVIVVADNCSDDTAKVARRHGALVWERRDSRRRGKGPALGWAFSRSLEDGFADAVVVVDADTVAGPNLLRALSGRMDLGAQALQAHYGVRNKDDSWRTVLMTLALALFHEVRSLGREKLGVSCGLRGNGMCFTSSLIARFPHDADSVVEDIEYGLILGAKGVRVHFVPEAEVLGEMPADSEASKVQRARWEGGRRLLAKAWTARLIWGALRCRSRVMLDLAVDLLMPPLSTLGGLASAGLVVGILVSLLNGSIGLHLPLFILAVFSLSVYLWRGIVVSRLGWRGAQILFWAPVYLVWRIVKVSSQRRGATRQWSRTPRQRGVG